MLYGTSCHYCIIQGSENMFVLIICANSAYLNWYDAIAHLKATTMCVAVVVKINTLVHLLILEELLVCRFNLGVFIEGGNIRIVCRCTATVSGITHLSSIIYNHSDCVLLNHSQNN